MTKTLIALRHICVKEFGVELLHEKTFRDLGSGFVFNNPSQADDIRDFQIEGMSIGDSLLNHFSKKKILASKVNWYKYLEKILWSRKW